MLVFISIPTLSLLFIQNKQVQTKITDLIAGKLSEQLQVEISVSKVHYSFFKRLQIYDFYVEDQYGDTLLYSEFAKIRIKKFRPDKLDIQLKSLTFENAYVQITTDDKKNSSIQFFVDSIKQDIPPEEKAVLQIDQMTFHNSRFRRVDTNFVSTRSGIDFSDLDVRDIDIEVEDFLFKLDTTYMNFTKVSGVEKTGFDMRDVGFFLTVNTKFMIFSEGWINTPNSVAKVPAVDFRYRDPKNFKSFFDSVETYISTTNSLLDFKDIAYFFPQVKDLSGIIDLNGSVFGRFGDLRGNNICASYLNDTKLEFDMRLIGMPSKDSLHMDFKFHEFISTRHDLNELTAKFDVGFLKDTGNYKELNLIEYQGTFHGYETDFETKGSINTNLGSIDLNLNMQPDTNRLLVFEGNLNSEDFMLGKLINNETNFGTIDFKIYLDGINNNGKINTSISGDIDTLGMYGYDYSNINLEGNLTNRKFDGSLFINDPNIDLIFAGAIDFENKIPAFDFTIDVANFRPYYLNLQNDDPEYLASFFLKTQMTGSKINELNGEIQLVNSFFKRTGSQIQVYDILLAIGNSSDSSYLNLKSDLIDAEIKGKYDLQKLPEAFAGILNDHFDVIPDFPSSLDTSNSFAYNIDLKNVNPMLEFFFPKFSIAKNSEIKGSFKSGIDNYEFLFNGTFPYFAYNTFDYRNMMLKISSDSGGLNTSLSGDLLSSKGGLEIVDPKLNANFANNTNELFIKWDNDSSIRYAGDIAANGSLSKSAYGNTEYSMNLHPSYIFYNNRKFDLLPSNITIDNDDLEIDSFLISGNDQFILADGVYSNHSDDSLTLSLSNLNLHMINDLNQDLILNIKGLLSGQLTLKQESKKPVFTSDLVAADFSINEQELGNISLVADWLRSSQKLEINLATKGAFDTRIAAKGFYKPNNDNLDFNFNLYQLDLIALEPYLEGSLEEMDGLADVNLTIDGKLSNPVINGMISFNNGSAMVSETKTKYFFEDEIRIYKNDLFLDDFDVFDSYDNRMKIQGNITTSNFNNIFLNLDIDADNFNFLSTTHYDNEQFYGDVFASATGKLSGPIEQLDIKISAISEKNTNLNLPLYNALEIQTTDYIIFVQKDEDDNLEPQIEKKRANGITLNMDLEITSNTSAQLIFDPKVGDIIEVSANGNLKVELDDNGDFSVFGDVLITDGEYLFTLQNVINKRFRVKPGGTIAWNGAPTSATVNLEAVYETKASTYSLAPEPTEDMKKRIPVHCLLALQGDLSKPTIIPNIELPTAEPETRSIVETSIGTDEELMRQFISLLIINNFISSSEYASSPIPPGVAGVTASELLSNQLSNWLSQISSDFNIGVNYRPGDAISSDEVEVALSTQLLNDRIIFSGNLDVVGNESQTPIGGSNIVGDFDLEFVLTEKISFKAFNRVNDDRVVRPSLYTQGVGVQYRSEFNTISELFQRNKRKRSKDKKQKLSDDTAAIKEENPEIQSESPLPKTP
jgi:hypothetical protein